MQLREALAANHGVELVNVARWWQNGSVDVMACQSHERLFVVSPLCDSHCVIKAGRPGVVTDQGH